MKFLFSNPFFRILLAFIAGILTFNFVNAGYAPALITVLAAAMLMLISQFITKPQYQYRFRWLFGLGALLAFCALGYSISKLKNDSVRFSHTNVRGTYWVEVTDRPVEKEKSYKCVIKLIGFLNKSGLSPAEGNAVIYIQKSQSAAGLNAGERILVHTTFKEPPGNVNPEGFNYKNYLYLQGISATAYADSTHWEKAGQNTTFSITKPARSTQSRLIDIYKSYGITGDEYAVLSALTLGYTDELQPELMAGYSASGAMHILSVSGLHVGIVYMVIAFLLRFLSGRKSLLIIRAVVIILFLWVYAFITGLSPSVIRSAMMFSFVAIGTAFERKSQIFNTVFASAFLILLFNPNYIFNVGFQLSYAAVISILVFQKPFSAALPVSGKFLKSLRDLLTVSVAAQLGTLPFTLYYFQQFPNYFLITNLIAIPLSGLIIYTAMALLAFSAFIPVAAFIAKALQLMIFTLNYSINFIYQLPFSVSCFSLDLAQSAALITAIAFFCFYFYQKKAFTLTGGLIAFLIVISVAVFRIYDTRHSGQFIVYSSPKNLNVNFIYHGKNYYLSDNKNELKKTAGIFWRKNFISEPEELTDNSWHKGRFTFFAGKSIVICDERFWKLTARGKPLVADILIIGNKLKPKSQKLFSNIRPGLVITDATISEWYTENLRKECAKQHISFYAVAEKGAFQYKTKE